MKNWKKAIALVASAAALVSVAACGSSNAGGSSDSGKKTVGFVAVGPTVKTASFNRPDHYYDGVVTQINPLVDDKGQINVRAKVNNTDGKLLEGMNVTVLVENLVRGQLAVPKSAVVIRDNQEVLFRLGPENKAMWTYVNVVMSNSDSHVVAPNLDKGAELNAGDVIITSGNLNLADGSQVEVRKP